MKFPDMFFVLLIFFGCSCSNGDLLVELTDRYDLERINRMTIKGSVTGEEITFTVYLPPSYFTDSEKSFPVVFHLHGLNDKHDGGQIKTLPDFLELAWSEGVWEEAIIVFPDGKSNSMWSDSYDQNKSVETHIIKEIIPFMDDHFRTIPDKENRFVQGFSMGGFGALKLIGKYPEIFGKAMSFDGALHNSNTLSQIRASIFSEIFDDNHDFFENTADPRALILSNSYNFKEKNRIHISFGIMPVLVQFNTSMHDFMNDHSILHTYVKTDCGHNLTCILNDLGAKAFHFYEN